MVLKHIIKARGECADWFGTQIGDEVFEEKNLSHQHAIIIFKEVLNILLPKAPKQEKNKDAVAQSDKSSPLNLSNAFEGLDVEEPPSDLEEMVVETQLVKKKPKTWEETYEMEDPVSDVSSGYVALHTTFVV